MMVTQQSSQGWQSLVTVHRPAAAPVTVIVSVDVPRGHIWVEHDEVVDLLHTAAERTADAHRATRALLCDVDIPVETFGLLRFAADAVRSIQTGWTSRREGADVSGVQSSIDSMISGHLAQLAARCDAGPSGREALLHRMRDLVETNLDDAELSAQMLARRCEVSVEYVEDVFGDIDTCSADYIDDARRSAGRGEPTGSTRRLLVAA